MIPSDILVLDKNRNIKNAFLNIILVICLQCQMDHYWFPRLHYISPGRRRNFKCCILYGPYLTCYSGIGRHFVWFIAQCLCVHSFYDTQYVLSSERRWLSIPGGFDRLSINSMMLVCERRGHASLLDRRLQAYFLSYIKIIQTRLQFLLDLPLTGFISLNHMVKMVFRYKPFIMHTRFEKSPILPTSGI
jgi:hypothetical protein